MVNVELLRKRLVVDHTPDFSDPVALLYACHDRIEAHLAALEGAVELLATGRPEGVELVRGAAGHFAVSGRKHTEDEEASLFPRLRTFGGEAGSEVLGALDSLEAEHREADVLHAELDAIAAALAAESLAGAEALARAEACVAGLTAIYRPHMRLENEIVFPAAARLLDATDIAALGAEMYARRRVGLSRPRAR
jgi:hemerythrin-like domain-containing protein